MNSEELEHSLKSEFESYLKTVLGEMKQETAEFQARIEAEFEKQKSQIDEAFRMFSARFDSERTFDAAFESSLAEHLRLARDEGARVAANAMVEAESLGQSPLSAVPIVPPVETKYDAIRDAVDDISSKDSQSAILKALVHHAASFAPRGAFFIIKSEQLAGWKVFGASEAAEAAIRDIHFPVGADSILGAAVTERVTVTESRSGDAAFIDPLEFTNGQGGIAIPLVARGRGVAVLYADLGSEGGDAKINREALETIVRVAGLTVELLASMQAAKSENRTVVAADLEEVSSQTEELQVQEERKADLGFTSFDQVSEAEPVPSLESFDRSSEPAAFTDETVVETAAEESFAFSDSVTFEGGFPQEVLSNPFDAEPASYGQFESGAPEPAPAPPVASAEDHNPFAAEPYPGDEAMRAFDVERAEQPAASFEEPVNAPQVETFESPFAENHQAEEPERGEMVFDRQPAFDAPPFEDAPAPSPFEQPREQFEPAAAVSSGGFAHQAEVPVIEAPVVKASTPRLSDRNVDLPIEVPEEERRIHNDARRFARLLVSEIKLYNEKKVTEGREASDLYERLREAIDRSREMYDKRVQPPVAAKFDYFHYEIVNSLAEGNPDKLGSGYPGASV